MNLGDDAKSRQNRLAYLDNIRPLAKPVDEAFFAGLGLNAADQSVAAAELSQREIGRRI